MTWDKINLSNETNSAKYMKASSNFSLSITFIFGLIPSYELDSTTIVFP